MEKSIKTIWKDGFLKEDALIVPKLNDLYNRKSEHIVEKYKRMFSLNLKALFFGSFIVLLLSFLVRIPYMGVMMFFILNTMVLVDRKLLTELDSIDKNVSSYDYLKTFKDWMEHKTQANIIIARIVYPCIFMAMLLGFWMMNIEGNTLGDNIVSILVEEFPNIYLVFGIPLFGIVMVLITIAVLAYFGERLYRIDISLVYGGINEKLEELIADIEELRKD